MKRIRYLAEAALLYTVCIIFRLMPLDRASACGGWIGRTIGPRLAASRKAYNNLNCALPEIDPTRQREIVRALWDNLGRTFAEYPHLEKIGRERVEIVNSSIPEQELKKGKGLILIGAHLGNWEINLCAPALSLNLPIDGLYRAPNNPWSDRLLHRFRTIKGRIGTIPKSRTGARAMVETLKSGHVLLVLIDQKYNEGLRADFFGRPAMTSTAFARLSEKLGSPVIPVKTERLKGAHFRLTFYDPLPEGLSEAESVDYVHGLLEGWIRDDPGQWLWLHRRWVRDDRNQTGS